MNKCCLIGKLTRDPEVRYSHGENPMCIARFTLAVNRRKKDEADFISCVAFGKTGEFVQKYAKKGGKFDLSGRIQTGSYKDKEDRTVYTTEVVVEDIEFGESKKATQGEAENEFVNVPDEVAEDLPFN